MGDEKSYGSGGVDALLCPFYRCLEFLACMTHSLEGKLLLGLLDLGRCAAVYCVRRWMPGSDFLDD